MASNTFGEPEGPMELSVSDAIYALSDIIEAYQNPSHVALLETFRKEHGGNMIKRMQIIYPAAIKLQAQVISKYGFSPDGEGVVQFTQTVKMLERQDPEVARLNLLVKQHLLPPTSGAIPSGDAGYACSSTNLPNTHNQLQMENRNQNQYYLQNHQASGNTYKNRHF